MNRSQLVRLIISTLLAGSPAVGLAADSAAGAEKPGIVLLSRLEKPKEARQLEVKDFAGYLMVYFKVQIHSACMAISETRDFVTYTNIGRFYESVMRGLNFAPPKHGAVTYLTSEELKTVAVYWKVGSKLN